MNTLPASRPDSLEEREIDRDRRSETRAGLRPAGGDALARQPRGRVQQHSERPTLTPFTLQNPNASAPHGSGAKPT